MLKPAILYREEIQKKFAALKYTDAAMYYNGCIEDGRIWIDDCEYGSIGVYQFAIVNGEDVVGFISWRTDYYSSVSYNFGLISFTPDKPNVAIATAILSSIKMIQEQGIQHIEFGAVEGNPVIQHYDAITSRYTDDYIVQKILIPFAFKDRKGSFHGRYLYLMLKKGSEESRSTTITFNDIL